MQRRTIVSGRTKKFKIMQTLQKHLEAQVYEYLHTCDMDDLIGQSFDFSEFNETVFVSVHDRFQTGGAKSVKWATAKFFYMSKSRVKHKIAEIRKKNEKGAKNSTPCMKNKYYLCSGIRNLKSEK